MVDERLANGRVPYMRAFGGMVRVDGRSCFGMVMGFCGALLALCGERVKREICSYGGFTWVANRAGEGFWMLWFAWWEGWS